MRISPIHVVIVACLTCGPASAQKGKAPVKGPYLQYTKDPSARSITIKWETEGNSIGQVQFSGKGQRKRLAGGKKPAKQHEVALDNLSDTAKSNCINFPGIAIGVCIEDGLT